MKLSKRLSRTYAVVSLAARVYLGYKLISVRQKHFGLRQKKANRQRLRHHTWSANHFYDTAVQRQGLLIKLGQIIGSRPDLIPDEYIDVLSRLQDDVPPRTFKVIRRVIERELKRPLAELFDDFEETPIASASLAQVHRARLKPTASEPEGRVVAVKVQYPGIEEIVDNDLQNVRFLLR
ncbi:MAG: AarF/ABC1/UbiB kinase family protein, partial [Chloroflexi bacterium]|nr:AarF/ABC1/UbiB kinase family protein [Chloroflexota bacterium]